MILKIGNDSLREERFIISGRHQKTGNGAERQLCEEVDTLFSQAFPQGSEEDRKTDIYEIFHPGTHAFTRQAILLRNQQHVLTAIIVFDYGTVTYNNDFITGIYLLDYAVLPAYQGKGIGQFLVAIMFNGWNPAIVCATCSQSSSLHSLIRLPQKALIKDFEVFPRLTDEQEVIVVPEIQRDALMQVFAQLYLSAVNGKQKYVEEAIKNLTSNMVRKNMYGALYEVSPWGRDGKEDTLANALGVTQHDGVLVIFRKKG